MLKYPKSSKSSLSFSSLTCLDIRTYIRQEQLKNALLIAAPGIQQSSPKREKYTWITDNSKEQGQDRTWNTWISISNNAGEECGLLMCFIAQDGLFC